jgi:DHA2 family multidrug resistance protein
MGNASGIFNLLRNVGGSIGISIATTLLTRRTDAHQNELTNYMPQSGLAYQNTLAGTQHFLANHVGKANAGYAAKASLYQMLGQQSAYWAFIDVFRWLSLLALACIVAVWFFKKVKPGKPPAGVH